VALLHAALQQAADRHVTVVASSGDTGVISDNGPPKQVSLPASDPLVLGAGGAALNASTVTGAYQGEMAWNADTEASAGGYSSLFPRPAYQGGVQLIGRMRGVPDVAADADASTAMALTFTGGVLYPAQGTSAATPLWAAVIALADQDARPPPRLGQPRHLRHRPQPRLPPRLPRRDHRRQTRCSGPLASSTGYTAAPGWDPVTRWGSPNAHTLVPLPAHPARHGGARS
jgi:hypothetical protein